MLKMVVTDDVNAVVIATELILPVKTGSVLGKAGNIFISGAKLYFNPTDGGAPELVTSA